MNTNADHPVWDVYDEFRTARFNLLYYEKRLRSLRRKNFLIELVLALSVSSGIAGLWFLETTFGGIIWKILVTLAAFLGVVRPLVKLSDQIQQKSEVLTSWRLLDDWLQKLTISIRQYRKYDDEMQKYFFTLLEIKSTVVQREPLESIDERLKIKCFEQVKQELPSDNFFVPEE